MAWDVESNPLPVPLADDGRMNGCARVLVDILEELERAARNHLTRRGMTQKLWIDLLQGVCRRGLGGQDLETSVHVVLERLDVVPGNLCGLFEFTVRDVRISARLEASGQDNLYPRLLKEVHGPYSNTRIRVVNRQIRKVDHPSSRIRNLSPNLEEPLRERVADEDGEFPLLLLHLCYHHGDVDIGGTDLSAKAAGYAKMGELSCMVEPVNLFGPWDSDGAWVDVSEYVPSGHAVGGADVHARTAPDAVKCLFE